MFAESELNVFACVQSEVPVMVVWNVKLMIVNDIHSDKYKFYSGN